MGSGSSLSGDVTLNSSLPEDLRSRYQGAHQIRRALRESRTIAMVGLSANPQKASHFVATYLQYEGYRIIPVNPGLKQLLGEQAYPDLLSIPQEIKVDMVDVFRPAEACPEIARQSVQIGAKTLWLQLKIISLEAAQIAEQAGMNVILDKCVKMEHGRYNGSLHWVGMNTEILTAKKARRWF